MPKARGDEDVVNDVISSFSSAEDKEEGEIREEPVTLVLPETIVDEGTFINLVIEAQGPQNTSENITLASEEREEEEAGKANAETDASVGPDIIEGVVISSPTELMQVGGSVEAEDEPTKGDEETPDLFRDKIIEEAEHVTLNTPIINPETEITRDVEGTNVEMPTSDVNANVSLRVVEAGVAMVPLNVVPEPIEVDEGTEVLGRCTHEVHPPRDEASFKAIMDKRGCSENVAGLLAKTEVFRALDIINAAILEYES